MDEYASDAQLQYFRDELKRLVAKGSEYLDQGKIDAFIHIKELQNVFSSKILDRMVELKKQNTLD